MKTLKEIVKQKAIFLNDWKDEVSVIGDFENIYITGEEYKAEESPWRNSAYWNLQKEKMDKVIKKYENIKILFASYGRANYSGDAWVLFEENEKLFEINGSHCSCYGLENQWTPDEVSLLELENRLLNGTFGEDDWSDNNFKEELCEFLGVEFKRNLQKNKKMNTKKENRKMNKFKKSDLNYCHALSRLQS